MDVANIYLLKGGGSNNPKRIILHAMGQFITYEEEDMYAPYFLKEIGLSAHRLLDPSGVMVKCRADTTGAYHAKGHNTDTLGIEFLVEGVHTYDSFIEAIRTPYMSPKQFKNGVYIVKSWMEKWDIGIEDVVTHQEIDPSRKYDPGTGFPLEEFKAELI